MTETIAACESGGALPFADFNCIHVVRPCPVSAAEVVCALNVLDTALTVADSHYTGG